MGCAIQLAGDNARRFTPPPAWPKGKASDFLGVPGRTAGKNSVKGGPEKKKVGPPGWEGEPRRPFTSKLSGAPGEGGWGGWRSVRV